jgi:hypothetical protein
VRRLWPPLLPLQPLLPPSDRDAAMVPLLAIPPPGDPSTGDRAAATKEGARSCGRPSHGQRAKGWGSPPRMVLGRAATTPSGRMVAAGPTVAGGECVS